MLAVVKMRKIKSLCDSKQVCLMPNPNSQSSVVLGRSFSVTQNELCVSVVFNTLDTTVSIKRGRKLSYTLRQQKDYEETSNLKKLPLKDCPTSANKNLL